MMHTSCVVIPLALLVALSSADIPGDEVLSLPGWQAGKPPTRQYSGYINLNNTQKFSHYWFVESANDPANDPVVLWLNGGPGCSSLDGYFNENGPLHFNRGGSPTNSLNGSPTNSLPTLIENPYSWNKIANMLYLESPVGVGFSYSDNPSVDYNTNDNKTADDNFQFLVQWFDAYSEYKGRDFYISGESYAGIYIPTLVNKIRQDKEQRINLKGFMVGNGCIGNKVGGCGDKTGLKIHVDFYHYHALFPDSLYQEISATCNFDDVNEDCEKLLAEMSDIIGKINIYDIYDVCLDSHIGPNIQSQQRARDPVQSLLTSRGNRYYGPYGCINDSVESTYFNESDVRKAIHVESIAKIGGWRLCTGKISYDSNTASLLPLYPELIKQYRTMIFNGDVDGCVPYIGNEQWTSGLGFKEKSGWRAWYVDDQVAGYITEYEENDFKFVTVKGAGHMVPQYRPKQALAMFERFILNKPF